MMFPFMAELESGALKSTLNCRYIIVSCRYIVSGLFYIRIIAPVCDNTSALRTGSLYLIATILAYWNDV